MRCCKTGARNGGWTANGTETISRYRSDKFSMCAVNIEYENFRGIKNFGEFSHLILSLGVFFFLLKNACFVPFQQSENSRASSFETSMAHLQQSHGFERVLFSCEVMKVRTLQRQQAILLLCVCGCETPFLLMKTPFFVALSCGTLYWVNISVSFCYFIINFKSNSWNHSIPTRCV